MILTDHDVGEYTSCTHARDGGRLYGCIVCAIEWAEGRKHLALECAGHKIVFSGSPRTDNHKQWARQRGQRLVRLVAAAAPNPRSGR